MKHVYNIKESEERWKNQFLTVHKHLNFAKYIKNSKKHLDFGCGFGVFTYRLAKKHPKTMFFGTDIDKKMLSYAKEKYVLKNLSFKPDKNAKYDSMSFIYVLHHIEYTQIELRKILKSLNKKGKVFILEFKETKEKKFQGLYNSGHHDQTFKEYYNIHNRWSKKEFEQMCKDLGLKTLLLKDYGDYWFVYVGDKK
jgi:ubiquinone/menaquinone biosynthesis C-methylase UbiE